MKPNPQTPLIPQLNLTTTNEGSSPKVDHFAVVYEDHEANYEKQKLLDQIQGRKRRRETNHSDFKETFNSTPMTKTRKVFLATGIPSSQRPFLRSVIERLGGKFIYGDCWDFNCTHIIIGKPSRTEKCLAACAAGTWFLKLSFIEASDKANEFIQECLHECKEEDFNSTEEQETIRAARKWRSLISSKSMAGNQYVTVT